MQYSILFILSLFFFSFQATPKRIYPNDDICDSIISLYKESVAFGADISKVNTINLSGSISYSSTEYKLSCLIKNFHDPKNYKLYYKLENNENVIMGGRNQKFWENNGHNTRFISDKEGFNTLKIFLAFMKAGENLINYKSKGFSATYLGQVNVNKILANKIRLENDEYWVDFFLNSKDNTLLMTETNNGTQIHYANYKKVIDSYFPHYFATSGIIIEYDRIIFNAKISNKKFTIPN